MHASRWPWLTLIACAAATGGAAAQVAPSDAGYLPPTSPPAAADSEATERSWVVPPLQLTGSLAYDMHYTRAQDAKALQQLVSGTIGGSTYIYQPWFANVSGSLGLTGSWGSSSGTNGPFADAQVHDSIRTHEQFVTGNGRVDLFPRSRFPFEMHFERQDSRVDAGLASGIAFQRSNFGLSQQYRPENGLYNIIGRYDHYAQSGLGFSAKQDSLSTDFNTHWKANDLTVGGSFNRARSEGLADESRFSSIIGNHAYTPSSALSVNTTANLTRTEGLGIVSRTDLQVLQLSSVGLYHADRSPLTLTGSVRGLVLREPVLDSSVDSIAGTVGANYEVNANLRLSGNVGATVNHFAGGDSTLFAGSAGATYQGDTLDIAGFQYNWFTSGNVGASVGDTSGNVEPEREQSLNLQLGHTFNRVWRAGAQSNVSLTAGQTLSSTNVHSNRPTPTGLDAVKTLLNTIAGTWQNNGDGRTAYARLSFNDSSEIGGRHAHFQLFNFQVSGNLDLGYGRTLSGDITWQKTMQRAGDPVTGSVDAGGHTNTSGVSGEVNFLQNQLFNVPRLRFNSRLRLAQDVLKQPGQLASIPDRETRLWENRLEWNIGRLQAQVELRLSQLDGRRVDSMWLRIQRNFGD